MNKAEQLIEYITRDIIEYHMLDENIDMKTAMSHFYNSEVFKKLQDTETGIYLYGAAYVYDLFRNELENGKIIQAEI